MESRRCGAGFGLVCGLDLDPIWIVPTVRNGSERCFRWAKISGSGAGALAWAGGCGVDLVLGFKGYSLPISRAWVLKMCPEFLR
jgi:hypothetical protein